MIFLTTGAGLLLLSQTTSISRCFAGTNPVSVLNTFCPISHLSHNQQVGVKTGPHPVYLSKEIYFSCNQAMIFPCKKNLLKRLRTSVLPRWRPKANSSWSNRIFYLQKNLETILFVCKNSFTMYKKPHRSKHINKHQYQQTHQQSIDSSMNRSKANMSACS